MMKLRSIKRQLRRFPVRYDFARLSRPPLRKALQTFEALECGQPMLTDKAAGVVSELRCTLGQI